MSKFLLKDKVRASNTLFTGMTEYMCLYRSSRPEVFFKKGVLRNFVKFIGEHLCERLFLNKVAGLKPATLLKKRLWHRCFYMNFATFLRTPFFYRTPVAASACMLLLLSKSFSEYFHHVLSLCKNKFTILHKLWRFNHV